MKNNVRFHIFIFEISLVLVMFYIFGIVSVVYANSGSAKGEATLPWSGYWWSRKSGFLVLGWKDHKPSPFEKYDSYVTTRTGKNPGAWQWEYDVRNQHYNPKAEKWEGHCNGWAAASILAPEPRINRWRNNIWFSVGDQKGILSEQYMNAYCLFFGKRYWGNHGDDINDIYPHEFHRILLEYIGNKKMPIVCDTSCNEEVWNFPAFKFESSWNTGWFNDKVLKVRTRVYYVDDDVHPDYVGTKWFSVDYTYNLFLDDVGNIVGGEWTGESKRNHPDFVWIPTADAPNPPGTNYENPRLDPRFIKEITEGPEVANFPTVNSGTSRNNNPDTTLIEAGVRPNEHFEN